MNKRWSIAWGALLAAGALFAAGTPGAIAADKPAAQTEQKKAQPAKDKPPGKPSGTQRKKTIPET